MNVNGKVILITGASAGIGRAAAELLSREGAKVALAARSVDKLKEISANMRDSFVVYVDMAVPAKVRWMVEATYEHYGRIDVLINNAGRGMSSPLEFVDLDDYASIIDLNVYGPLAAMQTVIPIMRKQGGGTIVNISSKVTLATYPNLSAYASTKSALNMLTQTARRELEGSGIIVSLVYPGLTSTDFRQNSIHSKIPFEHLGGAMPEPDSAEKVARRIFHAIETGAAEEIL